MKPSTIIPIARQHRPATLMATFDQAEAREAAARGRAALAVVIPFESATVPRHELVTAKRLQQTYQRLYQEQVVMHAASVAEEYRLRQLLVAHGIDPGKRQ